MIIKNLLQEIRDSGYTDGEIGKVVGLSQATINRIRNGKFKSTNYEVGLKIKELAESVKSAEQVK